ncbi:MAG: DUF6456 domain-containing protein [Pseudolabrys sp.]
MPRLSPSRVTLAAQPHIDPSRARHLAVGEAQLRDAEGVRTVTINEAESALGWLARRKGRDGRPLIEPVQLLAGERLRADFTRAHLMPRMGADWSMQVRGTRRDGHITDVAIAARQRVENALEVVGPEFSGLLLDICCFLKMLADVERERGWPARSGKVILQLGLDRLARHYGYQGEATGRAHASVRTWFAEG